MSKQIPKTPAHPTATSKSLKERSSSSDIADFLKVTKAAPQPGNGRLVFALDATMSRQPSWDRACAIQASMFEVATGLDGLAVQLVCFRGFGECKASKWAVDGKTLSALMSRIKCRGGTTQIGKVLSHTIRQAQNRKIAALVFIGDAMEEDPDKLCQLAGTLGIVGTKAFMFHEGNDFTAESVFREIARLSGGAYMKLSHESADELEGLLRAVAVFASGGMQALEKYRGKSGQDLLEQLKH